MNNSNKIIDKIYQGENLNFEESKKIFLDIMNGKMTENLIYDIEKLLNE